MINIGWIGIGNMGVPMVKNLVKAGFKVTIYNRTKAKALELQKEVAVDVADTAAQLVLSNDVIITMLSDDAALNEVYNGQDGILSADAGKNLLAIDMSTVSPDTTKNLAALCAEKGIGYLDAPVSGSVKPAEDAQLIIMVGGAEKDYTYAQPIFNALGKMTLHLGDNGAGNNAKLAINLFLAITIQGLSESLLFAKKQGIEAAQFLDIVNNGAIGSGVTKLKAPYILQENFKAMFALKHLAKDLRLAKQQGLNFPAGDAVAETYQLAEAAGLGEADMVAILKQLER